MVVHTERRNNIRIISVSKATQYKKRSTSKDDQDIPEFKREQLGVRGKHHKQFMQGSNVVVLQPEILKATSKNPNSVAMLRCSPFACENLSEAKNFNAYISNNSEFRIGFCDQRADAKMKNGVNLLHETIKGTA